MRVLIVLALLAVGARAQGRSVAEILSDHAAALGDVSKIRSLRAHSRGQDARAQASDIVTTWRLPGDSVRAFPVPEGELPRREWLVDGRAFVSARGFFERHRGNQRTTRGGYYMLKGLAELFPLAPYFGNEAAQRGLQPGAAKGYEVLRTEADSNGVRTVYLLDARTHLLANVRYEIEQAKPFAQVVFGDHRAVAGIQLPHALLAIAVMEAENDEKEVFKPVRVQRSEAVTRWEVDPAIDEAEFEIPGLGKKSAPGFETRTFATGPDPHEIGAGDLDGDGKLDFAVACEGGVWVHFGGAEDHPVAIRGLGEGHNRGLAIADLDRDGRPEVITTSNLAPASMYHVLGFDGARACTRRTIYGAPGFTHAVVAHDLDRDGLPDLIATGFGSKRLSIKFSNGAGGVRLVGSRWPLANPQNPTRRGIGLAVGRLDADQMDDIAVCDGTRVVVFQGQPNLSFQPHVELEGGPRPVDVVWADLNGDGRQDLVVANDAPPLDLPNDVTVVLNDGEKLKVKQVVRAGARVQAIGTGHFNGDAHLDVVATSFLTGEARFLYGDGEGDLAKPEAVVCGRGACRLRVCDHDGDGADDVLVVNRLDDSVTLVLNRPGTTTPPPRPRGGETGALACPPPTEETFALKGLSDPYEFVGEFRLPEAIRDPSDLVVLGGDPVHSQLLFVSDKESSLFRATLDRHGKRLLVGPAIPLLGLENERLDLEAIAYDPESGNLFLGCEADGSVVRATVFGHVLGRTKSDLGLTDNDGLEALALRRLKDGTPLLYAFRERVGTTLKPPEIHLYELKEAPFALQRRGDELRLPLAVADQTGAVVVGGDRMLVVSRFARAILEVGFDGDGFAKEVRTASYKELTDDRLGLVDPRQPLFGNVEGVAVDPMGDLFLVVDHNGATMGREGRNRGACGRILWFRNRGEARRFVKPQRVIVKQIHIPWAGAQGAPDTKLTREEARDIAAKVMAELKDGADFDQVADRNHYVKSGLPRELIVVDAPLKARRGERTRGSLPAALGRLIFSLEVGEVGVCEYHATESPFGYHVCLRVE